MTLVKICGLTNLDDAFYAVETGADMLGFIFFPKSPRYIQPQQVRAILDQLGSQRSAVKAVGVFVNETPQSIITILEQTGLDLAQLSGDESVSDLDTLAGHAYKVVRNVEQANLFIRSPEKSSRAQWSPDLLLDADHPTLYGGSGMRADDSIAASVARQCRLLLAGGLKPDNVADAIATIHPWGVDVASGVEALPGKKDHDKIRRFISAVRQTDGRTV